MITDSEELKKLSLIGSALAMSVLSQDYKRATNEAREYLTVMLEIPTEKENPQ